MKPGIPKFSAQENDGTTNPGMCPLILHPTKHLGSQVQMKSDSLIKTIGLAHPRSQLVTKHQTIVKSTLHRSIMESQNVSPLIISPHIHNTNDMVPAKIIPTTSSVSHFSVISKQESYRSMPEYSRHSIVEPSPIYTQSDFVRFPTKTYNHKSAVINHVIHGPISGYNEDQCLTITNSQHVFKPILSPRPSILRKRDADGILRAQKNLIPILTKPDLEHYNDVKTTPISQNSNSYSETGLQLESIMIPQISALTKQSHIMVEISPRKKPRKQLLPTNQDSPFKIVGDEMEYVDEKMIKTEKIDDYPDENVIDCNDNCTEEDIEDEIDDDLDDDGCIADDDFDDDDMFDDAFDYDKSNKTFYEEVKMPADLSDESSSYTKVKNKRPTLMSSLRTTWRGQSHHFQRYTDFKIKETKKQLAEIQQVKKWSSDKDGWRVKHLLKQIDGMVKIEIEVIKKMTELISMLENRIKDYKLRYNLIELVKDNLQRSKVTKDQLQQIIHQLTKIFEYKTLIEDVVEKYCPKDIKKKCVKIYNT